MRRRAKEERVLRRALEHSMLEALCSQGGKLGPRGTDRLTRTPRIVTLGPLRGGIDVFHAFNVPGLFTTPRREAMGSAWPHHVQRYALLAYKEEPRLRPSEANHPSLPPRREMSTYRV